MDYESFKRLGLDHCLFDQEKSYEQFDHTTHLFLLKVNLEVCPTCGSTYNFIRNSKVQYHKYASALEDNINIALHRRVYKCKDCNHLFKEKNPFGDSRRSLTLQKEIKILNELKNINSSYTSVAERFNVSPTTVINIFDKKVDLKRELFTEVICVDEVYSRKISFSSYCFIIYSPQRKTILDVLPSRKKKL